MYHKALGSYTYCLLLLLLTMITFVTLGPDSSTSYGQLETTNSTDNDISVSNATQWKTYSNEELGISFEYPSDWDLEEKENRFDTGSDVTVSNGLTEFAVKGLTSDMSELIETYGLTETLTLGERSIGSDADSTTESTVIEEAEDNKYKIDGLKTGTILLKLTSDPFEFAKQLFLVSQKGKGYMLSFMDSTETFDEPDVQDTMNKIIQSIKFS